MCFRLTVIALRLYPVLILVGPGGSERYKIDDTENAQRGNVGFADGMRTLLPTNRLSATNPEAIFKMGDGA